MTLLVSKLGSSPEDYFRAPGSGHDDREPTSVSDVYVAPSIMRGQQKYSRMLERDSMTQAWKVALKTDRRAKLMYEDRLPAGFPLLHEFFTKSKSLRVFEIGFETYRSLYEQRSFWVQWFSEVENIAQWQVQALRNSILTTFTPSLNEGRKPTKVQLSILRLTVKEGLWPVDLAPDFPKRIRLEARWGLLRWACRVRTYAKMWVEDYAESKRPWGAASAVSAASGVSAASVASAASGASAVSPSLKRARDE